MARSIAEAPRFATGDMRHVAEHAFLAEVFRELALKAACRPACVRSSIRQEDVGRIDQRADEQFGQRFATAGPGKREPQKLVARQARHRPVEPVSENVLEHFVGPAGHEWHGKDGLSRVEESLRNREAPTWPPIITDASAGFERCVESCAARDEAAILAGVKTRR